MDWLHAVALGAGAIHILVHHDEHGGEWSDSVISGLTTTAIVEGIGKIARYRYEPSATQDLEDTAARAAARKTVSKPSRAVHTGQACRWKV